MLWIKLHGDKEVWINIDAPRTMSRVGDSTMIRFDSDSTVIVRETPEEILELAADRYREVEDL